MRRMLLLAALGLCGSAQAEDGDAHLLRSSRAEATSYLQSGWNRFTENYHPTYVLDEDPTTAWIEGVEGNGEGSVLTLPLSTLSSATSMRLRIRNGYQKSAGLLRANAAPNDVEVRVYDVNGVVTGTTRASLAKEMGWQLVDIPIQGGVASVQIEVLSTHDGSRYRDTCISDVLVEVSSEVPYNGQAEAAQLAQARAWIAERVASAESWSRQASESPFASHSFNRAHSVEVDAAVVEQRLAPFRGEMAEVQATSIWYRPEATQRVEGVPSGAWAIEPLLQYTRQGNITWAETDRPQQPEVVESDGDFVYGRSTRSQDRVVWRDEARTVPQSVYFHLHSMSSGRGTYFSEAEWLVRFDENGRMTSAMSVSRGGFGASQGDHDDSQFQADLFVFEYRNGQIVGWDGYSFNEYSEGGSAHKSATQYRVDAVSG